MAVLEASPDRASRGDEVFGGESIHIAAELRGAAENGTDRSGRKTSNRDWVNRHHPSGVSVLKRQHGVGETSLLAALLPPGTRTIEDGAL